ncbi:MAG: GtrA family protein [Prevotella sp.]|nr:GtrA family protein [Prevotella sp.]
MKFVMVGIINTIVGTTIMFVFYNLFHLNYWISSASNYFFGSICIFILNKHFNFNYKNHFWSSLLRFTINILTCYLLAYGIAKTLIKWILSDFSTTYQENIAMIIGMCLFVVFNYLGKRFFTFNIKYEKVISFTFSNQYYMPFTGTIGY